MPKRVVHLITHFALGGATETVLALCKHADRSRFEVSVLCGHTDPKEDTLFEEAQQAGIRTDILPGLCRSIRPPLDLKVYRRLIKWLAHEKPDVLHTHGSKAGILGRLASARAGVPTIVHTVHGWGHHNHMSPLSRSAYIALERRAACVTSKIIAVAEANVEKGLADGIGRPEQYTVIHSGIDIARFRDVEVNSKALRAELGIPIGAPVVGTVSRLAAQKAPEDFLKVAALVHARCPGVHFVFIGGGPMQKEFQQGIQEQQLGGVVHDPGYRQDIPSLLGTFDIFLLTSLWEGLPRVFPQAMCAGLPIVATRVDGAPEAVSDGENGYLFAPRDCLGMADGILRLLGDSKKRREFGKAGLERVYPAFCDRDMTRRVEAVYEEFTNRSPVPGLVLYPIGRA
jgi:glycosyltransferase involved in cell wall biosynthesis